jgi:hypothetical protein
MTVLITKFIVPTAVGVAYEIEAGKSEKVVQTPPSKDAVAISNVR